MRSIAPEPAAGPALRRPLQSVVVAAWLAVLTAVALVAAPVGGAAGPAPVGHASAANAALDWITTQFDADTATMPGFGPGTSDWGLTVDAVLALAAGGRGDAPVTVRAVDALADAADSFTTWAPSMPEVRVAGATAKVVLAMETVGHPTVLGGVDMESELRSLMVTAGGSAGRFVDRVPNPDWNTANAFGQSFAILALASTPGGVPVESIQYLFSQQCPSGGFPLDHLAGGCVDDSAADTDATAVSVQALLTVDRDEAVSASLRSGVAWLASRLDPLTGAVGGAGPTAGHNSNSTGLVAQTLRAAGRISDADRAAGWISGSNQLTDQNATGGPAGSDIGAIAYDPAALAAALTAGITPQRADQWRRSTAQAVLALGLPNYGPGDVEPLEWDPVPTTTSTVPPTTGPTTTTTAAPTTTTTVGDDGSVTTTTADAGPSATVGPTDGGGGLFPPGPAGSDPAGSDPSGSFVGDGSTVLGVRESVGTGGSDPSARSRLAWTGSQTRLPLVIGLILIVAGSAAVFGRRILPARSSRSTACPVRPALVSQDRRSTASRAMPR